VAALAAEDGLPVTTSAELTGLYGLELRTVTAALNAAVGEHHIRAAPGPAGLAAYRRHGLQERDQLGDVVAVAAGHGGGQRDPVASVIR
jgi:hypothetical protein